MLSVASRPLILSVFMLNVMAPVEYPKRAPLMWQLLGLQSKSFSQSSFGKGGLQKQDLDFRFLLNPHLKNDYQVMEQHTLKNVNNYPNNNIYPYFT
jgi:hypothetical protein